MDDIVTIVLLSYPLTAVNELLLPNYLLYIQPILGKVVNYREIREQECFEALCGIGFLPIIFDAFA